MRISDRSSDVCSSDLRTQHQRGLGASEGCGSGRHSVADERPEIRLRPVVPRAKIYQAGSTRDPGAILPGSRRFHRITKMELPSGHRSEEHTSELQSLMRISYAVFCLQKKKNNNHKEIKMIQSTTS